MKSWLESDGRDLKKLKKRKGDGFDQYTFYTL